MASSIARNGDRKLEAEGAFWRGGRTEGRRSDPADLVLIASDAPLVARALVELLLEKCSELRFVLDSSYERSDSRAPLPALVIVQTAEFRPEHPWLSNFMLSMSRACPEVPLMLISEMPVKKVSWTPLEYGFSGYIPTSQSSDQLVSAIRVLIRGGGLLLHSKEPEYKM